MKICLDKKTGQYAETRVNFTSLVNVAKTFLTDLKKIKTTYKCTLVSSFYKQLGSSFSP